MDVLLDKVEVGTHPTGRTAGTLIVAGPFPNRRALVMATATGSAHYEGPRANAGILLELRGGPEAVRADSFEGESSNIGFNAAASTQFVLGAGNRVIVGASVLPKGAGAEARNRDSRVVLHVVALDLTSGIGPVHP
jgi:hypothetical protein